MDSPDDARHTSHLRTVAAEMVRTTALKAIAAEISRTEGGGRSVGSDRMSPAQLRSFLSRGDDHARIGPKPEFEGDAAGSALRGGEALILGALVRDLPPERRLGGLVTLLGTIASLHRQHGLPLPCWFSDAALTTCSDELCEPVECRDPHKGAT